MTITYLCTNSFRHQNFVLYSSIDSIDCLTLTLEKKCGFDENFKKIRCNFLVFLHKMAIFDHIPFVPRFIWPSSCITLFHTVGLIGFIALFWFKFSLSLVFGSWKLHFFSKKTFRNKFAIMAYLHLSEKISRLGCPLIFVSYNF